MSFTTTTTRYLLPTIKTIVLVIALVVTISTVTQTNNAYAANSFLGVEGGTQGVRDSATEATKKAEEAGFNAENKQEAELPVCLGIGGSLGGCGVRILYGISVMFAWLLSVAGDFFDTMLGISLDRQFIDADFANQGWTVARDLANVAFIFILLYIAISTILQASSANIRRIVPRLIIVALLVNFSLFFTKVVIDSSNILALAFYNNISVTETIAVEGDGYVTTSIVEKDISKRLVDAFSPATIIGSQSFNQWSEDNSGASSIAALAVTFLGATVVYAVAAYVLLIVGILFVGRLLALWFLMVGAPVAFLAWIMPDKTGSFASKWWNFLLRQSFLAPFFLFFLFLIMQFIVASDFTQASFTSPQNQSGAGTSETIISILIKMSIIIGVLMIALRTTQKLSTDAANSIVKGVKGAAKFGGKFVARKGLAPIGQKVGQAINERTAKGGAVGRTLGLTGIGRLGGALEATSRKTIEEDIARSRDRIKTQSTTALKNIVANTALPTARREAAFKELEERKDLKTNQGGFSDKKIKAIMTSMKSGGRSTEKAEALMYQYATSSQDMVKAIGKLEPKNVKDIDKRFFDDKAVLSAMHEQFSKEHIGQMIRSDKKDRTDNADDENAGQRMNKFVEHIRNEGDTITNNTQVSQYFSNAGNDNLASWSTSPMGVNNLEAHGFEITQRGNRQNNQGSSQGGSSSGSGESNQTNQEDEPQILGPDGQPLGGGTS